MTRDLPPHAAPASGDGRHLAAQAEVDPDASTPASPQAAQAVALLPPQLLQPDEIIILLIKPSAWFILLAPLKFLAIVALAVLAALWLTAPEGWRWLDQGNIVLLGSAAAVARVFWQFLVWLSHVYVLTDRRIIRVQGVTRVSVFETSLKQVQHTTAHYSIRERLFGLGSIGFATAGTDAIDAWWRMIARPLEVHQQITRALSRYR